MSINTLAAANGIIAVLEQLSGLATVQIGVPLSVGTTVSAWVGLGGQADVRKATAVVQKRTRFFVMFCYRVDGNETTAETALMTLVDAFTVALNADLTLGGTVKELTISSAAADEPDYQLRAGKEYREYPMVIEATQHGSYTVNP